MLANASGQLINFSNFANSLDLSQPTAKKYFRIAEGTFLWRYLESYHPQTSKRVTKMPKGHLRDSGLLCHMLRIYKAEDLRSHPHFGLIWESFIVEQILKNFEDALVKITASHYRSRDQAEIDLILEGPLGLIPIEIKSGSRIDPRNLRTMQSFIEEQQCPYGIVINNASAPVWLSQKIYQVPAACL